MRWKTVLILPWQARKLRQKTETAFLLWWIHVRTCARTLGPHCPLLALPHWLCAFPSRFQFLSKCAKISVEESPIGDLCQQRALSELAGYLEGHGVRKGWVHLALAQGRKPQTFHTTAPGPWKDPTTCIQGPAWTLSSLLEPAGYEITFLWYT